LVFLVFFLKRRENIILLNSITVVDELEIEDLQGIAKELGIPTSRPWAGGKRLMLNISELIEKISNHPDKQKTEEEPLNPDVLELGEEANKAWEEYWERREQEILVAHAKKKKKKKEKPPKRTKRMSVEG
jgi:hypothetical protein